MAKFRFFVLFSFILKYSLSDDSKCSYEKKCELGDSNMVNIHVISHTHDDAGWLKTVDEYYVGSKKYIDHAGVLYIIDSIIDMLESDIQRKFSYVEGAFMYRWLMDHNENDRKRIIKLVENGQLEILSGGWVMNDEACTHYSDIIQQMSLGFKMHRDIFGECALPRTGWQIDPFGHSAAQADLLAAMGFDGLFFGRVSDKLKVSKAKGHGLEFLWHTHPDFSRLYGDRLTNPHLEMTSLDRSLATGDNDMFVSILPNLYQPPPGFCFDIHCGDESIQDDPEANGYNMPERVLTFLVAMESQARSYDSNHILVTMGSDFHYQAASNWYRNLDKLIKHVNIKRSYNGSTTRFNMFYSTPGCYLYALRRAKGSFGGTNDGIPSPVNISSSTNHDSGPDTANETTGVFTLPTPQFRRGWPHTRGGDFFPLINSGNQVWTGYFTSRPTLKGMVRDASQFLQVCKQIEALATSSRDTKKFLKLEMALALLQHHDGVSGTAKQYVTNDYMWRLSSGYNQCQLIIEDGLKKLGLITPDISLSFCPLLNISLCPFTQEKGDFDVMVYNPLAWSITYPINLPVGREKLIVLDSNGTLIPSQIINVPASVNRIPDRVHGLHGKDLGLDMSLVFVALVPPIGISYYKIRSDKTTPNPTNSNDPYSKPAMNDPDVNIIVDGLPTTTLENGVSPSKSRSRRAISVNHVDNVDYFIENEYLKLEFDPISNGVKRLINKASGIQVELSQQFAFYGKKYFGGSSGAYVFRANDLVPNNLSRISNISLAFVRGQVVQQVRQKVTPWIDQEFTLYQGKDAVEISWTVGPVPMKDGVPKDVVTRFETDIKSATPDAVNHFYTDSNARFMIARKLSTDPLLRTDPNFISDNYYPINSKIFIRDELGRDGTPSMRQLGIVVDRSQGGSSPIAGSIEIMVHRRLIYDDGLGVGEPLNEPGVDGQGLVVRGRHWLVFDMPTVCDKIMTQLSQTQYLHPELIFVPPQAPLPSLSDGPMSPATKFPVSLIYHEFPSNLHFLTLSLWDNEILIRLEHIYSPGEHSVLSKPVSVDLKDIFNTFSVTGVVEMSLGGDRERGQVKRTKWPVEYPEVLSYNPSTTFKPKENSTVFVLHPLDIRTFRITYSHV